MTLESIMSRLADDLCTDGSVDVQPFVTSCYPNDIGAGLLLMRAFDAGLLRGRLSARMVECDGRISAIIDDTRPVWH